LFAFVWFGLLENEDLEVNSLFFLSLHTHTKRKTKTRTTGRKQNKRPSGAKVISFVCYPIQRWCVGRLVGWEMKKNLVFFLFLLTLLLFSVFVLRRPPTFYPIHILCSSSISFLDFIPSLNEHFWLDHLIISRLDTHRVFDFFSVDGCLCVLFVAIGLSLSVFFVLLPLSPISYSIIRTQLAYLLGFKRPNAAHISCPFCLGELLLLLLSSLLPLCQLISLVFVPDFLFIKPPEHSGYGCGFWD
jgi:hypothetical protein